ncbi:MAG: hypothetical protein NW224_14115 [Leptolyngbyaceae cyanobacterium bins.302]|nr:hypothetical protein [Leptolyngbyaceae cyanobacterium bins.302]
MASEQQIRQYLAYWFQLGKGIVIPDKQKPLLPRPVIQGNHYSSEFEAVWREIMMNQDCYLEGTHQSIAQLLSPLWEINPCARCSMPVPFRSPGLPPALECPCSDLPDWPNTEIPQPREPVDNAIQLTQIRDRLRQSLARQER